MKDFWAEGLQNHKKGRLRKIALLVTILLIIIAIMILIGIYFFNIEFRNWCDETILRKELLQEDTKHIELEGDANTQVYAYDQYICVFRKKKLEFYNKVGTLIEDIDLDINSAVFASAGRYVTFLPAILSSVRASLRRAPVGHMVRHFSHPSQAFASPSLTSSLSRSALVTIATKR